MKAQNLCPTPHLSAADFEQDKTLTISRVDFAEVGQENERKGVVYFDESQRGLVINRTNLATIVELHGNETDDWIGKQVTLYADTTPFGGKVVPCVRIRPGANGAAGTAGF